MADEFVYYNVNEEGLAYERHLSPEPALATLARFPNDTVVVCTNNSPVDDSMPMVDGEGPFEGID